MTTAPLEPEWYVARNGKRFGPMSDAEFRKLAREGLVREDDYIWRQGFDDWVFARNVPGLLGPPVAEEPAATTPFPDAAHQANMAPESGSKNWSQAPQQEPQYDAYTAQTETHYHALPTTAHVETPEQAPEPDREQSWSPELRAEPYAADPYMETTGPAATNTHEPSFAADQFPQQQANQFDQPQHHEPHLSGAQNHDPHHHSFEPQFTNDANITVHGASQFSEHYSEQVAPHHDAPKKGGILRKMAYAIACLLFLGVLAAVAIPFVVPTDAIRDQVVKLIKEETGRDVIIRGRTSIAFFPNIGVKLSDITLANPPGMAGEPFLHMSALTVDLKLLPLLTKQVELDRFVLKSPKLSLIIDREGRNNWQFDKGQEQRFGAPSGGQFGEQFTERDADFTTTVHSLKTTKAPIELAQNTNPQPANPAQMLNGLSLGDIRIIDGSVSYEDTRNGSRQAIENINISVAMKTLAEPLSLEGDLAWRGETVDLTVQVATPDKLVELGQSPLELSVNSRPLTAQFSGNITDQSTPTLIGKVRGQAPSLDALMQWSSAKISVQGGAEAVVFSGDITANAEKVALNQAKLGHGSTSANGLVNVVLNRPKPFVQANLRLNHLDLNKYVPNENTSEFDSTAEPESASVSPPPQPVVQPEPQSLTALIQQVNLDEGNSNPVPRNSARSARPSANSSASLQVLRALDADITVQTDKLTYQKITLGATGATAKLNNGKLAAKITQARLYGGVANGDLTIDSTSPGNPFQTSLNAQSISALPFLQDAMNFDWISGRANINIALTGSAAHPQNIMQSLDGTGAMVFADGAIEGINIPGMIRNLQQGKIAGLTRSPSQKTDFSQFSGTFLIERGIAKNTDLKLASPLLRMTGAGTANLVRETLDYQLQPKLVASLQGQNSNQNLSGIEIPVRITGPWRKPSILPDTAQILKNPENIVKGVQQIGNLFNAKKKLKGGDFESIINNVLGGGNAQTNNAQPRGQKRKQAIETNKLLKQLLSQ